MLALAPAFLILAAADAAPTREALAAIDEGDRRAADYWVKEGYEWTQELSSFGEALANMFVNAGNGPQARTAVRAEVKRVAALLDDRVSYFKARPSPGFPEMVGFRTIFVDYLVWERRTFAQGMNEALRIVENKKQTREERAAALVKMGNAWDRDEKIWKAKIQTAAKAVYAAMRREDRSEAAGVPAASDR